MENLIINKITTITNKLKEKTINEDGKFGFYPDCPSRNAMYWSDANREYSRWSISFSTDLRYEGIFWLTINGGRHRVNNIDTLLKAIDREDVISSRVNFYSYDTVDISNLTFFCKRDLGISK